LLIMLLLKGRVDKPVFLELSYILLLSYIIIQELGQITSLDARATQDTIQWNTLILTHQIVARADKCRDRNAELHEWQYSQR